jgi:hypothetical protein
MAVAGMYSIISFLISQRTSEIAIRIALGASRGAIVRTILGTTIAWVVPGLACGLGLAEAKCSMKSLAGIFSLKVLVYVGIEAELCFSLRPPQVRKGSRWPLPPSPFLTSCQTSASRAAPQPRPLALR